MKISIFYSLTMINQYLLLFILIPELIQSAKEVVLLDTRDARDSLNWLKISSNGNFNDGWGELSFEAKSFPSLVLSSSSSTLWRTQYVCDITSERRVDNWLRSPYIKRQQAQRIEIELGFSIRDCSTFQTPNEIRSCRETFELYIHENDIDDKNQNWSSYKLIDIIAGNRFTSNNYGNQYSTNRNNLTVNIKTRGIPVEKNGFYLAFRDQGACISLLYVKIYYRLCEDRLIGLVQFPETSIGSSLTDIVERYGICSINSELKRKPIAFCKGNGEWTFEENSLHDSCHCQQGYEFLIENNPNLLSRAVCKLCPTGTYKSIVSNNQLCQTCPLNSHTKEKGATFCHCNHGFFRLNSSLIDSACIGNPDEPENIAIDEIDQTSIRISWKYIDDRVYHLECHQSTPCKPYFIFQPNRTFINNSNVKIFGLEENTSYKMKIFAEQISTGLLSKAIELSFTTKRSIAKQIRGIDIHRLTFNTVRLSWFADDFLEYELLYWSFMNENEKHLVRLTTNNYTLTTTSDLYKFQIRAKTLLGWTAYSEAKLVSLQSIAVDESMTSNSNRKNLFLLSGPMFILALIVLVLICAMICSRKKRPCRLKNPSDCESLDYQKRQVLGHYGPDAFFNSNWTAPLWPSLTTTAKTYIDPHTYEDPTKAINDFAHELDPNMIVIESVIGGGEFGDVCRGKLRQLNSSKELAVAIKTLKQGASEKTRLDFLSEASIMGQFNDENVIYLQGVVTKHHPIMIVTEYMENGSLDTYLRTNEGNRCLDALQLTRMLKGIASGMRYLAEMKYVHRDLAARNILVNKDLVCKVADFGLSREIDQDDSYTTKGGKIPIRWTAIEAIDYRKFTSASDVWSFGVLTWEVFSFGERPYWNWSNQDVMKAIKSDFRLPPPLNCPEIVYKLMLSCWNEKYLERPKFDDLVQQLTHLIQFPNRLIPLAKQKSVFVNNPDQPNLAQLTSISQWLESLQLDHLASFFHNCNYTNLSQICHFNLLNLTHLLPNHISLNERTRLLENLAHLRSQLVLIPSKSSSTTEGFLV